MQGSPTWVSLFRGAALAMSTAASHAMAQVQSIWQLHKPGYKERLRIFLSPDMYSPLSMKFYFDIGEEMETAGIIQGFSSDHRVYVGVILG